MHYLTRVHRAEALQVNAVQQEHTPNEHPRNRPPSSHLSFPTVRKGYLVPGRRVKPLGLTNPPPLGYLGGRPATMVGTSRQRADNSRDNPDFAR